MAIFNRQYLLEIYNKNNKKLYDDEDDEEDETDDESEEDDEPGDSREDNGSYKENKKSKEVIKKSSLYDNKSSNEENFHLTRSEIRRAINTIMIILSDYKKMKKCCDYVDLNYRENINDDGMRESPIEGYMNDKWNSYLELIDGDIYSGYPDFKNNSEEYERDEKSFVKDVNDLLKKKMIKAKFMVGPHKEDDAISFGIKSTKNE